MSLPISIAGAIWNKWIWNEMRFSTAKKDHLTKFVVLNALKTRTALEVGENLIKIFSIFGSPKILHSDNGREIANSVICKAFLHYIPTRVTESIMYFMQRFMDQINHRKSALCGIRSQADKMLEASKTRFGPVEVGTNVRIPIPEFDRSKVDPRNIMGVVLEEDNGFYTIGTTQGVINQSYSRNQIDPCNSSTFLCADEV